MPQIIPAIVKVVVGFSKQILFLASSGGITGFVVKGALYLSGAYVLTAAASALQKKPDFSDFESEAEARLHSSQGPAAARRVVYGEQRVGGHLVYVESHGNDNKYINTVWALAGHESEAIDDIYLDDTLLTFSGSDGAATNADLQHPDGYGALVLARKHLGTADQTVDTDLDSISTNWTSAHRLRGITYVMLRLHWHPERMNAIPNLTAVIRGKNDIYDWRDASTGYTTNAPLCLANYLMDTGLGLAVAQADIDSTTIQASANRADESVALNGGGTESRYTLNGTFQTTVAPKAILEKMLTSMAGTLVDPGGIWYVHAGEYTAPTITLSEDHLRDAYQVQTKPSKSENANAIRGIYANIDANYQPDDFPPVINTTYATEDGETTWRDIDLPFTTSSATAQRLAKIELERTRQPLRVSLPVNMHGFQVQEGDTVGLTLSRMGWTNKVFDVLEAPLVIEQSGDGVVLGVNLLLQETASTVYDWSSTEETPVDPAPNTNLPDPGSVLPPTGLAIASGTNELISKSDGTILSRAKLSWTAPLVGFSQRIQPEYKKSASGTWIKLPSIPVQETQYWIADVEDGVNYDFRVASINGLGVLSAYNTVTAHTVVGKTAAPSAATNFALRAAVNSVIVTADMPSDVDLYALQIQWDTVAGFTSEPFSYVLKVAPNETAASYTINKRLESALLTALSAGETIYVRIRTYDTTQNTSAWSSVLNTTTLATNIDVPDWRRYGEIGGAADFVYSLNKNFSGVADDGELLVEGTELIRPDGTKYTFKKTSVRTDLEGTTTGVRYIIHLNNSDATTLWPLGSWGSSDDTKVLLIAVKAIGVISGVMNYQAIDDDGVGYTLAPNQSYTLLAKIEKTDSNGGINGLWPLHTGLFTYNYLEMGLDATYGGRVRVYDDAAGTTVLAKYEGAADGGMLELNDDAGSLRAKAYVDSSKRGRINIYDELGNNTALLYDNSYGGSLILRDDDLNTTCNLYTDSADRGNLRLYNEDHLLGVTILADANGGSVSVYNDDLAVNTRGKLYTSGDDGRLILYETSDALRVDISAGVNGIRTLERVHSVYDAAAVYTQSALTFNSYGGQLQINDTTANAAVRLGVSSGGFSQLQMYDNAGELVTFLGADADGGILSIYDDAATPVKMAQVDATGAFWSLDSNGYRAQMNPVNGFRVFNTSQVFQGGIDVAGGAEFQTLILNNLPTSAGATGTVWNDSGTLKLS